MIEAIEYRVRASERARRVRVTVDPARGVEVVVPASLARRRRGSADRAAAAAIAELRPWIERRQAELRGVRQVLATRSEEVPYLGLPLRLVREEGRERVHRAGDDLLVPAQEEHRLAALERWYRRAARIEVAERLDRACALAGTQYTSLSIRGQRTRWGSCSRAGAMSFNWRLLLAPEPVLDYVVWHEVCHLEVMDHSRRFWSLLESRWPDYRRDAAWLRRHGATLALSGAGP